MILDSSKLTNLLSKGYALISDTVYLPRYVKTFKETGEEAVKIGDYLYLNGTAMAALNATAQAAIDYSSTSATSTKITNDLSASTFINAGASSNYTRTAGELKATNTELACTVVTNAYTIDAAKYIVPKFEQTLGTGTITTSISIDGGTTYKTIKGATTLAELPAGTSFILKFQITGNAIQKKWGVAFR